MSTIKIYIKKEIKCKQTNLFQLNVFKLRLHLFLFFSNAVSTHFHFKNLQFPSHLSSQDDFKQFHTAPNCFNPPSNSYSEKTFIHVIYTNDPRK